MALDTSAGLAQGPGLRFLCILALGVFLAGLYFWGTCVGAKRRSKRLHERLRERERIARALHDTLLQNMQALVLRFHGIAKRLPADSATRVGIEDILDQADVLIAAGRDEVLNLRSRPVGGVDVVEALSSFGKSMQDTFGPRFTIAMRGKPRNLAAHAWRSIYSIGREALLNAYLHAGARHIELEIVYGPDAFWLLVRSDGVGTQDEAPYGGATAGHRGLGGMTERARALGGTVDLRSRDGKGVELALRIPAPEGYLR